MNPLIVTAIIAGAPLLLAILFRVSSVYLFASIAAGALLERYMSDSVTLTLDTFLKDKDPSSAVHIALLVLPFILTVIFLRKTLRVSKFILELIPIIASIAMLFVLLIPQLPASLRADIAATPYGKFIHQSTDIVIGAAVLLNLVLMWILNKKRHEEGRHHGHRGKHH